MKIMEKELRLFPHLPFQKMCCPRVLMFSILFKSMKGKNADFYSATVYLFEKGCAHYILQSGNFANEEEAVCASE